VIHVDIFLWNIEFELWLWFKLYLGVKVVIDLYCRKVL